MENRTLCCDARGDNRHNQAVHPLYRNSYEPDSDSEKDQFQVGGVQYAILRHHDKLHGQAGIVTDLEGLYRPRICLGR